MLDFLARLLSSDEFMPHGHCYLWRPGVIWLHVVSDGIIGLAYTTIPFTLLYFVRRRRELPFHWMFLCFGVFIIACGGTHFMEVLTTYTATYWLSGYVKLVTAVASLATCETSRRSSCRIRSPRTTRTAWPKAEGATRGARGPAGRPVRSTGREGAAKGGSAPSASGSSPNPRVPAP